MEKLLKVSRIIDAINEIIGQITTWLVLVLVIIGGWNVIGRYVGRLTGSSLSSNAYIEAQWYIFSLIFFFAAAYALKHNEHVRVDVFYSKWNPRRQALIEILCTIFFLIPFCILVIFYSWEAVVNSWSIWETSSDPGGLPRYPIKTVIIISFALLILQGVSQIIKNLAIFKGYTQLSEEHRND
ncbi:TRAP transporter small permease subunit [Rivularia sp. UHCC 0363]|uniref:TRAP transporter small permease subunit n=1 Tax=Rivularia sp. UHCC 0363 TaxID=3110244 RepID=UPI002B1F8D18|nr:TRAP transporter small permease subunit [Rivularia sp. UHCC 0363]MEA5593238.1 TRAP transporter small permease subunit [Rivularia sp. UHCC 0363]